MGEILAAVDAVQVVGKGLDCANSHGWVGSHRHWEVAEVGSHLADAGVLALGHGPSYHRTWYGCVLEEA